MQEEGDWIGRRIFCGLFSFGVWVTASVSAAAAMVFFTREF